MVKMISFVKVLVGLLLVNGSVLAASIDLNNDPDIKSVINVSVVGVSVDDHYYTVVMEEDLVTKIELDGLEKPDFIIETSAETIIELLANYSDFGWVQLAGFFINRLGVPTNYVFDELSGVVS